MSVDNAPQTDAPLDDDAVLLVGHGSRREKSNEQVREVAADLESDLGIPVDAAYLELADPAIPDAIGALAPTCRRLTVVPHSLFDGLGWEDLQRRPAR